MAAIKLVIANCNYSSWSLRAWLALRKSGVGFEQQLLPLDTPEFTREISSHSPTGRVPVLWHGEVCVWDSLAICEYVNEQLANGGLWPADVASRALGRSMVAEMHSGFPDLRSKLPMNCRARRRFVAMDPALQADIQRVFTLWGQALSLHQGQGPWLLGKFSIADAFFAPVMLRLRTYEVALPATLVPYRDHLLADPDLQSWLQAAERESWVVAQDEAGTQLPDE